MIDNKAILDGIINLVDEIENELSTSSIEKIIKDVSLTINCTLDDLKKNNYTFRSYSKGEDIKNIISRKAAFLGCTGGLHAGIKNDDGLMSPIPCEYFPCEDPNAFDVKFSKDFIENNKDRVCYMNANKARQEKLDKNTHHALTHLKRIKASITVFEHCDADLLYKSITSCDNYKILVNLKNTLASSRLIDVESGKLPTLLEKFFSHIERIKIDKKLTPETVIDTTMVDDVYKFCIKKTHACAPVFTNASKEDFTSCVESANFITFYNKVGTVKSKLMYVIYALSKCMGDNWYKKAAESINKKKKECSGVTIQVRGWKNDLIRLVETNYDKK